jgi:hypothetical protein
LKIVFIKLIEFSSAPGDRTSCTFILWFLSINSNIDPNLLAQMETPSPRYVALPAQIPQRVRLAVMLGHHAQTGGTAVHGIELFKNGKIAIVF